MEANNILERLKNGEELHPIAAYAPSLNGIFFIYYVDQDRVVIEYHHCCGKKDNIERLKDLSKFKEIGILTDEEFNDKKKELGLDDKIPTPNINSPEICEMCYDMSGHPYFRVGELKIMLSDCSTFFKINKNKETM